MKYLRRVLLLLFSLLLLYLLFYPVPIRPGSWAPSPTPAMTGFYLPNSYLAAVQTVAGPDCLHCEDVAADSLGRIYGGAENGDIIRYDNGTANVLANTGGRPLGLHFDNNGQLIVADAYKGLLRLDESGKLQTLTTGHGQRPFGFTNDMEVTSDGTIYFSDASDRFDVARFKLDLLEHQPNGRLLRYNPEQGTTELLLNELYFANGVALSADENFVLVCETGKYRVNRYWLKGPKKGQREVFLDNLPGYPDGISSGSKGIFWLTLISPRKPALDMIMDKPFLRKMVVRLPEALQPAPERYGFILGVNEMGEIVHNLQDPKGKYSQIASVQEYGGRLYFGSLAEKQIGWVERPD